MAQIITKTHGQLTVEESTPEVLDLLLNDKQFIIVNIGHTISVNYNQTNETTRFEITQTAINKSDIIQAF